MIPEVTLIIQKAFPPTRCLPILCLGCSYRYGTYGGEVIEVAEQSQLVKCPGLCRYLRAYKYIDWQIRYVRHHPCRYTILYVDICSLTMSVVN